MRDMRGTRDTRDIKVHRILRILDGDAAKAKALLVSAFFL